jgi:hypothetical protein
VLDTPQDIMILHSVCLEAFLFSLPIYIKTVVRRASGL